MWQLSAKVALTAVVVVAVSEIARRSSFWGAVLASLPLTSLLAFVWLYIETGNTQAISALSMDIFWFVLASLPLFLVLPLLLKFGWSFWPGLAGACFITIAAYFGLVRVLRYFNVTL